VTITKPLTATEWGTKGFYVEDLDGYIIGFRGRLPQANKSVAGRSRQWRRLSTLGYRKRIASLCKRPLKHRD
jgi:hypothetical protein